MDRYQDYVNYKIKYFKLKNNIDITYNNFIYDTNTDYNLKYNKYKAKVGGLRIGTNNNSVILNSDVSNYKILLEYLNTDEKLKLLETFVLTNDLFTEYLNEPYFTQAELIKIRRNCDAFAKNGCLRLLRFARETNPPYPWSSNTCKYAALNGHLNVLQWVRSQKPPCPWNEYTCACAARGGHLDILEWVRSQDPQCPWNSSTCSEAARGGHLDILQWVRSQDQPCPWTTNTCAYAARNGHLNILKWLRSQNPPCPWNKSTCMSALMYGHLHILEWVRSQKRPFSCN